MLVRTPRSGARLLALLAVALLAPAAAGAAASTTPAAIPVVGAESQYANVLAQVGGRYVKVSAIETNPNTDPHTFEASPRVAQLIAGALVVVQNGVGYDSFMDNIEAASGSKTRRVVIAQKLLGLPNSLSNPHLWYRPDTMPAVARAVAGDLAALEPAHAAYFRANAARFTASLAPWNAALKAFAARHPHTPVATTEPVGDYMLAAAGAVVLTPPTFEADVMNGVDPAPQDVTLEQSLLSGHRVKALLYNQQVTDSLTSSLLAQASRDHIPVVGVYETMPAGFDYQSWMLAEVNALERAVTNHISTPKL